MKSELVTQMSKKFEKTAKPQNAVERQRLTKDVEREITESSKPPWLKEKEGRERKEKIARDTSALNKIDEKEKIDKKH
jgi:hypothetical protein